jgi:hypothetical protein
MPAPGDLLHGVDRDAHRIGEAGPRPEERAGVSERSPDAGLLLGREEIVLVRHAAPGTRAWRFVGLGCGLGMYETKVAILGRILATTRAIGIVAHVGLLCTQGFGHAARAPASAAGCTTSGRTYAPRSPPSTAKVPPLALAPHFEHYQELGCGEEGLRHVVRGTMVRGWIS